MKSPLLVLFCCLLVASFVVAEPRVLVLPFDPIMDSLYAPLGGQESVLNYRTALQQLIATDLSKDTTIRVVDISELNSFIKSSSLKFGPWNDVKLAAKLASDLSADYAIIGTYGEFSRQIRVDARMVVAALADIPQGYSVTGLADIWDDMPAAAAQVSAGVLQILTQSGIVRPISKGYLFPEGDLASYDPAGTHAEGTARLVVWVNTPAPVVSAMPAAEFVRCSRIDRMNAPEDEQAKRACFAADVKGGLIHIKVEQRGYLPFSDDLTIPPGRAFRLVVNLQPIEQFPR